MTKLLKAGTESENQQPKKKIVVYYKNKGDCRINMNNKIIIITIGLSLH